MSENGVKLHCSSDSNDEQTYQSSNVSPPASKSPPFGCGCGKCTFFSFLERGCPKHISSTSSFPYLDISGLTDTHQQELKGRLQFESQKIMVQFQELVSATWRSLEKQKIPPSDIILDIMALPNRNLKTAKRVSEIFLNLNDDLSFFNYHIIEHIIKFRGTKGDKDNLQKYKEQFHQYAKRRIFECPSQFGFVSEAGHADVVVKLDSKYDHYTVIELEMFRCQLSSIFHLSPQGGLRLCQVNEGCIQITFQVPLFVQQEIFPLSREQEKALAAEGVISLTCGKYHFMSEVQVLTL